MFILLLASMLTLAFNIQPVKAEPKTWTVDDDGPARALNKTNQLGCTRLVMHTLAYLDALAPGAVLYIKLGGRIEAEYLHLVKELL